MYDPAVNFKRTAGGWVFRAPSPWIFGNTPHYLVSDEQKRKITQALTPRHPMRMVPIAVAAFAAWSVAVALVLWLLSSGQGVRQCAISPSWSF
jgi:hypothetical protein